MPDGFLEFLRGFPTGDTPEDRRQFKNYQRQGGGLSINQWLRQGKPSPPTQITARTRGILERTGGVPAGVTGGEAGAIGGLPSIQERIAAQQALDVDLAPKPPTDGRGVEIPRRPTEPPPSGFRWEFDRELNRWIPEFVGLAPVSPYQQETLDIQRQQLELAQQQAAGIPEPRRFEGAEGFWESQAPTDAFGRAATWNQRTGSWDYPPNFGQRPSDQPAPISPFQQETLDIQRQSAEQAQAQFQAQLQFQQEQARLAAEEQERQYRSQLAANPINWLQYSAYTGEQPVIQPWMVPLGFQNTGGAVAPQGLQAGQPQLQAGQPIPGFQAQAGQQAPQTFANLPQLTTPSAQLQARWGPTAQAQFLGYRQARTGAAPQETQFRLGAGRAPTGRFGGFSRFR